MFNWEGFGKQALDFITTPINQHKRITILSGSIRSGKTTAMIPKWLEYITAKSKYLKAIVGVSKETVYSNILADMFDFFENFNIAYNYNRTTGYLKVKFDQGEKNWTVVKVIGAKDKGSLRFLRGITLAGAYVDELTLIDPTFFKELLGRCSVEGSKIFCTTNPDSPNHYIYTNYVKSEVNEDVEVWTFLLTDNPTLSKEYVEFIKRQYKGTFYARFIEGLWVVAEGLVYSTFDKDKHIVPHSQIVEMVQQRKFKEYIAGIDWGYTDPMAVLLYGVTPDYKYYLIDEYFKTHKQPEDVKSWLLEKQTEYGFFIRYVAVDNARPEHVPKIKGNWTIKDKKPTIEGSISTVRSIINFDRLYQSDKCKNTFSERLSYRYPTEEELGKSSYKSDTPIDEHNHTLDSERYILNWYELKFNKNRKAVC